MSRVWLIISSCNQINLACVLTSKQETNWLIPS
jgi:hypothetical protein